MKELSIEEKAKAYDEALERARDLMTKQTPPAFNKDLISLVFPELAESKDERIKKCIIDTLKNYHHLISTGGVTKEDMIAWLEKQGKQKSSLPKWKYKKGHTPLLRDSLVLNKYGCVLKALSGAIISDAWVLDYTELAELPREEPEKQGEQKPTDDAKKLDADEVIEWIDEHVPTKFEDMENYVKDFKQDFGLC